MTEEGSINLEEEIIEDPQEFFVHHRLVVDPGQESIRIDKHITNFIAGLSRNRIQNAAKANCLLVNDNPVKSNYKVRPNDVITIVLPRPVVSTKLIAEDIPLDIRYEDDDLMVIMKPAGLVVHPGIGNHTGTLVNALLFHLQNLPDKSNEQDRPGIVHRLDKDTTGLMVLAKSELAMTHLAKQFFDRTVHRRYVALVWGEPEPRDGRIEGNIARHLKQRQLMDVFDEPGIGKHAITHYTTIRQYGYVSLVECRLETGRTHQIRVHFKHIGHPLFNDAKYTGDQIRKGTVYTKYKQFVENCFKLIPRQALHAKELGFIHPTTGKEMFFDSELPKDLEDVVDKWERYMSR